MAALDFPNSPTLNQQYVAPNGVTYKWDGTAWIVAVAGPPTELWTDTGTALTPYVATRQVQVTASGSQVTLGDATIKATLDQGTTGNSVLAIHENHPWAPQDTTKASYALFLDSLNDRVQIYRRAPSAAAGTVTVPFLLDNTAKITTGSLLLGPTPPKCSLGQPTADISDFSHNWTGTASIGWLWRLDAGADNIYGIHRDVAGSITFPFQLSGAGNLTITGATATKASGTTWSNPSDPRLKQDVAPYAAG